VVKLPIIPVQGPFFIDGKNQFFVCHPKTPIVIVDLEGTASKTVLYAIAEADLVIIPTQGSPLDARQAGRTVQVVRDSQKAARITKDHVVLLTRTNPTVRSPGGFDAVDPLAESPRPGANRELSPNRGCRSAQPLILPRTLPIARFGNIVETAQNHVNVCTIRAIQGVFQALINALRPLFRA
jgi:hypothetical protein